MSKNHEEFLDYYKKIENSLPKLTKYRGSDMSGIRWLEESMAEHSVQNKLRLCRMIRNYMQHNNDYENFIGITDEMVSFLKYVYEEVCIMETKASPHVITEKVSTEKQITEKMMEPGTLRLKAMVDERYCKGKVTASMKDQVRTMFKKLEMKLQFSGCDIYDVISNLDSVENINRMIGIADEIRRSEFTTGLHPVIEIGNLQEYMKMDNEKWNNTDKVFSYQYS